MYNRDYYTMITDFGDSITDWAKSVHITLEDALDAGVYSEGDHILVPNQIIELMEAHNA